LEFRLYAGHSFGIGGPEVYVKARKAGYNIHKHDKKGGTAVFLGAVDAGCKREKHDDAGGPLNFLQAVAAGHDPKSGGCLKKFLLTLGIGGEEDSTGSKKASQSDSGEVIDVDSKPTNESSDSPGQEEGADDPLASEEAGESGANEEEVESSKDPLQPSQKPAFPYKTKVWLSARLVDIV